MARHFYYIVPLLQRERDLKLLEQRKASLWLYTLGHMKIKCFSTFQD